MTIDPPAPDAADPRSVPAARQYEEVAAVYDALMSGVPHGEWLSRIEKALREREKAPRSALDVACGTGIITQLLHQRGYRPAVGVDIAPAMVAIARTKAAALGNPPGLRYEVQDAAALDLGAERFDFAVSMFDSLNYILDPEALRSALRRVHAHLTPGGLFAFDVNALYALSHDLFTQSQQFGPVQHIWKAHWDRETRLCRVEMDFWVREPETNQTRHFHETHVQRAYTIPELRQWLTEAGFVRLSVFGNYGERPPGPKSDRLLFLAEREYA